MQEALAFACKDKEHYVISYLMKKGACGEQEIFRAASQNDTKTLDTLLPEYDSVIKNRQNRRRSFLSRSFGHLDQIEYTACFDNELVLVQTRHEDATLHNEIVYGACFGNQLTLVESQYELYARMSHPFPFAHAIKHAIVAGHRSIIDKLLNYPSVIHERTFEAQQTQYDLLLTAVKENHADIIKKLIDIIALPPMCTTRSSNNNALCCMKHMFLIFDNYQQFLCTVCEKGQLDWVRYFSSCYDEMPFECIGFALKNNAIEVFQYVLQDVCREGLSDFERYLYDELLRSTNLPAVAYVLKYTDDCQDIYHQMKSEAKGWLLNQKCFEEDRDGYESDFEQYLEDRSRRLKKLHDTLSFIIPKDIITTLEAYIGFEPSNWEQGQNIEDNWDY